MGEYPTCSCGGQIYSEEILEEEFDGASYVVKFFGICRECGKKFTWKEFYSYSYFAELEEYE